MFNVDDGDTNKRQLIRGLVKQVFDKVISRNKELPDAECRERYKGVYVSDTLKTGYSFESLSKFYSNQ